MLPFGERTARLCEGLTRRQWLEAGGASALGLALPHLLQSRAAAATQHAAGGRNFGRAKSCIVLFLWGGHAHQDTWDLKPGASAEVRGEFQPIATSVPGTFVSELMPRTAALAKQYAIVRSVTHPDSTHTIAMHNMLTGTRHRRPATNPMNAHDDFPCLASVVQRLRPSRTPLPSGICINSPPNEIPSGHIFPGFFGGFLGRNYDPMFITDDPSSADFQPIPQVDADARTRLVNRQSLLGELDDFRRRFDFVDAVHDANSFQEKAVSLLSSPAAGQALDVARESAEVRERYGMTPFGQGALLARRLIEADVKLVTVNWARDYHASMNDHWDTHSDHFRKTRNGLMPIFDRAYSALMEDLEQRGLLSETLVVVLSEFGRSPKINKNAGRDHWPGCNSIVLAGAGIQGGVVYGASDSIGAFPVANPVGPEDVAATIYHLLGIAPHSEIVDHTGRPLPITTGRPIAEVFA